MIDAERLQALHKLMRVFALMTYDDWMACIDAATAGDEGMLRMIPLFAAATRHGRISELGRFMGGHERAYEATLCGTHVRPRLLLPHDGDDVPPTGTDD